MKGYYNCKEKGQGKMRKKIAILGIMAALATTTACGNKYITIGDYKGMEVEYTAKQTEVADADVQSQIASYMESNYVDEGKNVKAKKGSIVNIDYEGIMDGEAFEGGTAQGYNLELGSNSFIDGFEDGLIGAKKGQKLDLDPTFPKEYPNNPDMAGKAVTFHVTVNAVQHKLTEEEFTDAYVAENIKNYKASNGDETEVKTVDAYKEALKTDMEASLEKSLSSAKQEAAWKKIIDDTEIKDYPKDQLSDIEDMIKETKDKQAVYYGCENGEDMAEKQGMSAEDYKKQITKSAKEVLASRLVADEIADKEDIEFNDKVYKERLDTFAKEYYNLEDGTEIEDKVGKEEMKAEIKLMMVKEWVAENNTFKLTKDTSTQDSTDSTTK